MGQVHFEHGFSLFFKIKRKRSDFLLIFFFWLLELDSSISARSSLDGNQQPSRSRLAFGVAEAETARCSSVARLSYESRGLVPTCRDGSYQK